jgi:RimJ/RimL family protein N-acetyltransferase
VFGQDGVVNEPVWPDETPLPTPQRDSPRLEGDQIVLRAWTDDDADAVLRLADDPVTRRWSPSLRPVQTRADALGWVADRRRRGTNWAVVDPATDELLGRVGLHDFREDDLVAEIGYGVMAAHRGQGVATRAVAAVTAYGFESLGLHRITLQHAMDNTASCAVARVSGYAAEGVMRRALAKGDGTLEDVHLHGRVPADPPGPLPRDAEPIEPVELVAGEYRLVIAVPELDAAAVVAAVDDDDIRRFNPGPATVEDAYAWCRGRADWSVGTHVSWLVKDAGGALVGAISVFQINHQNLGGQAGYWVTRQARGRGVASSALEAAARFCFEDLGLVRVELYHAVENVPSCRTAERAGFRLEGTHRQSYRYGDGVLCDEHSHARLATD